MVKAKQAARAVGAITVIGFASKILGFVREMVLANYYGAGAAMDAYNIASNIPGILLVGLGTAITTTFIPAFTRRAERAGKEGAFALTRNLITAFGLVGLFICLFGILFAPYITRLLAPYFDPAKAALTTALSRILLLGGTFTILNGLCVGLLQAQERFVVPALVGFPMNFVIILAVVLFAGRFGIHALAAGAALAAAAQVLFQVPSIRGTGFRFWPVLDLNDADLRRVAVLVFPVFAGTMLLQVNTIVDRIFASGLPVGSISSITYANRINGFVSGIVAAAISTVALPALSRAAAAGDLDRLRRTMLYAARAMNALVIPMVAGLVVLRVPIVRLLFERGAFDARATVMTATALLYLSLGLAAYGLRDVAARTFYALQDTVTPMTNSLITVGINIGLLFLLVPRWGLAGLTGATSLSGALGTLLLFVQLRLKMGRVGGRAILGSLAKVSLAATVMAGAVGYLYPVLARLLPGGGFLPRLAVLVAVSGVGALVYVAVLWLLRAEEIAIAKGILRK
ncbi:MAG: murein biosynthesis integral membrane protein MurJ [Firmicutes bacterium]|nr:murein biosynthesis integral membrane protein MurJ [Bacillota bacterium]